MYFFRDKLWSIPIYCQGKENDCIFFSVYTLILRPKIRFSDKIKTLKLGLTFPPGKGKVRALMLDNLKPAAAILSTVSFSTEQCSQSDVLYLSYF